MKFEIRIVGKKSPISEYEWKLVDDDRRSIELMKIINVIKNIEKLQRGERIVISSILGLVKEEIRLVI